MKNGDYPGFRVTFWGTRGSIPTPGPATRIYGGNTSCVEIRTSEMLFILDAGTGVRELGLRLEAEDIAPFEGHFIMSHAHWDHIQGFPFFQEIYNPSNRFIVYEVEGSELRHHRLLSGQMQSDYFPVAFSELGAQIAPVILDPRESVINTVVVRAFPLPHPGGCYAYSFEKDGCRVVYSTDCELDLDLPDLEKTILEPHLLREVSEDYLEFIADSDLLIVDSQYTDEEYPDRRGWGHTRATTAVDAAIRARVRQVALFHHDPMHSDEVVKRKVTTCRDRAAGFGSDLFVFGAREGLQVFVEPPLADAAAGA